MKSLWSSRFPGFYRWQSTANS